MSSAILTLLAALIPQQVDGLRPGESAQPVDPGSVLASELCFRGRVLDGARALPLAGAELELWTEGPAPRRVAQAKSLADGSFLLPRDAADAPGQRADKLIVRATGFRSTLVSPADADEVALWPRATHLRLRVVDLEGAPIAGAIAVSRQTCAHAPPAWTSTSDARGELDLATFPPLRDEPEIFVTAPGFVATLEQDPDAMLAPGGLELRLLRAPNLALVAVDRDGAPLAGRGVGLGVEPHWYGRTTDARGRVEFTATESGRDGAWTIEHLGKTEPLAFGRIPAGLVPRLVFVPPGDPAWGERPDPAELLPVRVVDEDGNPVELPVGALHRDGSALDGVAGLGKQWRDVTLVAGGPFSGWSQAVVELPAAAETTLRVRREPVLTVALPRGAEWDVRVQAGEDSERVSVEDGELRLSVPRGRPLVVYATREVTTGAAGEGVASDPSGSGPGASDPGKPDRGESGAGRRVAGDSASDALAPDGSAPGAGPRIERRLARLGRLEADATLDLTAPERVLRDAAPRAPAAAVRRSWSVAGGTARFGVRRASERVEPEDARDALELELPPDEGFEGRAVADGRVPALLGPWQSGATELALPRRCALLVTGDATFLIAGGREATPEGDGLLVEDLAPGPLLVQLRLRDGRALALSLALEAGEQRTLHVR